MRFFIFILVCVFWVCVKSHAQDLHSSQPSLAAVQTNPANTGAFEGSLRFAARYRAQWLTVPVNYRTLSAELDRPFVDLGSSKISGGVRVVHDIVGDGQLQYASGGLTFGVAQKMTDRIVISAGVDFALSQKSVHLNTLKFQNQWNGDVFDPNAPNGEPLGLKTGVIPQISTGIAAHVQNPDNQRNTFTCGVAIHQLNKPIVSFQDDKTSRLAPRIASCANGAFQFSPSLDFVGFAQYQKQASYQALIAGAGLRTILGSDGDFLRSFQTTVAYRLGDAVIPTLQLDWGAWTVGFSYDINTSAFQTATQRRGAWELATVYRLVPVPKVPELKVCPVF